MTEPEQRVREAEIRSPGETERRRLRDTHETYDTQEFRHLGKPILTLQEAAKAAAANGPGDPEFRFARAVKAFQANTSLKLGDGELRKAFSVWWSYPEREPTPEADYEEHLFVFLDAYEKAKTPLGANIMQLAIELTNTSPLPPEAEKYGSPKIRRLVALCSHLQDLAKDAPFFLSVRDAARAIDIARNETAAALLHGLVRDGVLEVVMVGTAAGRRATRYRFVRQP